MSTLIEIVNQQSPLLGRQLVHDERSRAFPMRAVVDHSTWHDKAIRIYDPLPNPNQEVGCCTGVAKCVQFNAVGNRTTGKVLNMTDALTVYSLATALDPWDGQWPPTDTGSSGLASAKAAQSMGCGGEYRWIFGGADEVVQNVIEGRAISVGTWWYSGMFHRTSRGFIAPTGEKVGGHQYVIRGYDKSEDAVLGRCWWGEFRDFWMHRAHLDMLLADDGDAHWQARA